MKTHIKNEFTRLGVAWREARALFALTAVLGSILACPSSAQIFTTLHCFDSDGPPNGLILSGKTLYGTTTGTVFAVNTDGSGFTTLHSFTDGASLSTGIILSDNTLYGTTSSGSSSNGTVFKVNTDGTGFSTLHSFTASAPFTNSDGYVFYTNSDGAGPGGVILSNNTLYGTASGGGVWGSGTVFALNTDGTGFTNLYNFPRFVGIGSSPQEVILLGSTLFGAALEHCCQTGPIIGTLFALNTDGSGFRTLLNTTNVPLQGLIVLGGTLYGAVDGYYCGGPCPWNSPALVVRVNTDGTGSTNLLIFDNLYYNYLRVLILLGDTLYGISLHGISLPSGNRGNNGTVFAVNTDGTSFTVLHSFTAAFPPSPSPLTNGDGADPNSLILFDNNLYGTTTRGGSGGSGTIFSISLPPRLTMIPYGANVILTWPTNAVGYTVQSTTNLNPPIVWNTNSLGPVVIGGQNVVINPASGPRQFYRLAH